MFRVLDHRVEYVYADMFYPVIQVHLVTGPCGLDGDVKVYDGKKDFGY